MSSFINYVNYTRTHTHTYNYVFVGEGAKLTEIDHDKMSVWEHPFKLTG